MQNLFHLMAFKSKIEAKRDSSGGEITKFIGYIFNELSGKSSSNKIITKQISRIQRRIAGGIFDNNDQHDAQEFLKLLIY